MTERNPSGVVPKYIGWVHLHTWPLRSGAESLNSDQPPKQVCRTLLENIVHTTPQRHHGIAAFVWALVRDRATEQLVRKTKVMPADCGKSPPWVVVNQVVGRTQPLPPVYFQSGNMFGRVRQSFD